MDPMTDVAVSLKLQAALVPYRTRTEENSLLDLQSLQVSGGDVGDEPPPCITSSSS
jgi:hypothetical protein